MATFIDLLPLSHTGAVPHPHSACTDPTPDEQYRMSMASKQEQMARREEELLRREPEQIPRPAPVNTPQNIVSSASDLFTSLRSVAAQVVLNVEKGASELTTMTGAQVRQLDHQHNTDRFRQYFPQLFQEGEVLLADYNCTAMHAGVQINGHLQITRHYLLFIAKSSSMLTTATSAFLASVNLAPRDMAQECYVRQIIPLSDIACLQLCVALETIDHGPHYFLPLPDPGIIPNALQIYTVKDHKVFQFLKFEGLVSKASGALSDQVKGTALDRAYNYLDHAWRENVKVPVEGVNYE